MQGLDTNSRTFQGGEASFMAGNEVLKFLMEQGSVTKEQATRMTGPDAATITNDGKGQLFSGNQVADQLVQQGSATPEQAARMSKNAPQQSKPNMAKLAESAGLKEAMQKATEGKGSHAAAVSKGKDSGMSR